MPNPKRRHSKQRTAKRRSHDFLTPTGVSTCPNCGEPKRPHTRLRKVRRVQGPRGRCSQERRVGQRVARQYS